MKMDRLSLRDLTFGGWVSGVGHLVLIVWFLSGWGLRNQPVEFQVTPVTAISGDEYAQLVAASTPDAQTEAADAPVPPVQETPPEPAPTPDDVTPAPTPQLQPETPPEEVPPPPAPEAIPAPAEISDAPPEMMVPEPFVPPQAPQTATRPQPRPAPRVAAEAVAPPPPDADIAPQVQEEIAPEAEEALAEVPEEVHAAAPEEAATEIVTEADTPSGAPEVALRPQTRPQRPTPQPQASAEPETRTTEAPEPARPTAPDTSVDDALAAALATEAASASSGASNPGPPMTGAERDAFRLAVSGCWAVDPGSEAATVSITVRFDLDRQGRVVGNDVRLLNSSGGGAGAVDSAFQSARRAILRCQSNSGYQLPADKYEQWREVEMTFDPAGMRMR